MANNEKGLSKSISPNNKPENDVIVNISKQSAESVIARSEKRSKSDFAISNPKFRGTAKESMSAGFLRRKRKTSQDK